MAQRTEKQRAVFWDARSGLPREGPGSAQSTSRALELAAPIPATANILDIACGPGAQTMVLAKSLQKATISAIDTHQPFIDEANRRAVAHGVADRVKALRGDMHSPPFPQSTFELIWCESAAYVMGVDNALRTWKPLLKPGGSIALSEAVWIAANPSEEARRNWSGYSAMANMNHWNAVSPSSNTSSASQPATTAIP